MKCSRQKCTRSVNRQGLCHMHYDRDAVRGYVDARPTLERIEQLLSLGVGWRGIYEATGLTVGWVKKNPGRVQARTQQRVFSIPVPDKIVPGGEVAALGTHRRVQALAALGWPQTEQAVLMGRNPSFLNQMLGRDRVHSATAAAVDELYRRLCMTPGPSKEAQRVAARKGWAPPLAWDSIDDPDETPNLGGPARRSDFLADAAERRELVAQLSRSGLSAGQIAERLGVSKRHVVRYRAELREAS